MRAPVKLYLASSNPGKLGEYRALVAAVGDAAEIALELVPEFALLPEFEESAPTFGENALGKALYYSPFCSGLVFADDSGLVVPALGGAPGVHSARYAGAGASSEDRIAKLLFEMRGLKGEARAAYFVCVTATAQAGRGLAIVSGRVDGTILETARGRGGFGYDPVFCSGETGKTFAELPGEEKNLRSHRGKAFRRLIAALG